MPPKKTLGLLLFASSILLLTRLSTTSAQQCINPPLQENGQITWGQLPDLGNFVTDLDYTADGKRRSGLADLSRGFVDTVTSEAAVNELIDHIGETWKDVVDQNPLDGWSQFQKLASILIGIMVCLSVGVTYLLLVPLVGMTFGCCRCCDNCGGKRVQEESGCPGCMRVFLTLSLLVITGVLGAGMAYTNYSNDFINYSYDTAESTTYDLFSDVETFTTGTLNQMEYIAYDEYNQVDCYMREYVNGVGDKIGDPLLSYLKEEAGVQDALDEFQNLNDDLTDTYTALNHINESRSDVISETAGVKASLVAVKTDYDALLPRCTGCPDSLNLDEVTDYDSIPDVSPQVEKSQTAQNLAITYQTEMTDALDGIPKEISDSAQPAVDEINDALDTTKVTINEGFEDITKLFSDFNSTLQDLLKQVEEAFTLANEYTDYRYYGLIAVTCLTLLIILLNVVGITMGTLGYKDVSPTGRSRVSNAGGNILIAGVFFSVVFGTVLMLVCFIGFAASGSLTLTCGPLISLSIFEKTIDQPDFIVPGYYLGEVLFQNSTIELKATDILTECANDSALYKTFKLDNLFTLDGIEEELKKIEEDALDELSGVIDLPILSLVPSDLETQLDEAFNDINLGAVDPVALEPLVNQPVAIKDLTQFVLDIQSAIASGSNDAIFLELTSVVIEITRIQSDDIAPIDVKKASILSSAEDLVVLNADIPPQITKTANVSKAAETAVNSAATTAALNDITTAYVGDVFDFGYQFVDKVNDQLDNEVAKCKPVRNTYDEGVDLTCYYVFDAMNSLWFTTGWCAIFLLPSIVLAVRLAKYYRTMDEEALPKAKAKKSSNHRRVDPEMPLDDMTDGGGGRTGHHDNIRLVESISQGGMHPQQNPHYIPDDVINGYDSYNNLGRPMAPPPSYNPEMTGLRKR